MPFFKQLCSNLQNFNWDITLHGLPATAELFCLPEYHYHIFHKAKLHIIYVNLLLTSVFKDPFHHLPSMFQQLNPSERSAPHWVAFPFPFWGRQMDAWLFYYANCILWRLHNKKQPQYNMSITHFSPNLSNKNARFKVNWMGQTWVDSVGWSTDEVRCWPGAVLSTGCSMWRTAAG